MLPCSMWALLAQGAPVSIPMADFKKYGIIAGVVLGAFLLLGLLLSWLRGKKDRKQDDPEKALTENLATYPAAPKPGKRRLLVHGNPVRLRLVVIAPVGKRKFAEDGHMEPVLDDVVPGLGELAELDKPRVRVWPPQLSVQGFSPRFYRKTERPLSQQYNWVLVSGLAKAEGQPILLGLALWSDKPTKKGQLVLEPNEWTESLRVE
jgi:hypothetical protein